MFIIVSLHLQCFGLVQFHVFQTEAEVILRLRAASGQNHLLLSAG